MPFASKAQQRYFYANKKKLEAQGVDVDEWARETNFKALPEKASSVAPLPDRVMHPMRASTDPTKQPITAGTAPAAAPVGIVTGGGTRAAKVATPALQIVALRAAQAAHHR